MAPEAMAQVLRQLRGSFPAERHPDLLVGLQVSDDAAVYRLNAETAVIQTLDFFTPIVDDPYAYGAVAAANALSDVYAMGGEALLALNICCFPADLPGEVKAEILRGGAEKVAEAGAVIAGGHTVDDPEPKYGLAVTGVVHPDGVLTKAAARPGDRLLLTKPLGTGVIATALKRDRARESHVQEAVTSMTRLNRAASRLLSADGVRACTDVTGYALLGHAREMAERSGVAMRLQAGAVPLLPGTEGYAAAGIFPGGTSRNARFYGEAVRFEEAVGAEMRRVFFTPETSGGLLAAVPAAVAPQLLERFREAGEPCWQIGEVLEGEGLLVVV